MIYIDPPYNTGKNRLYKDKFTHSEWLNMMYSRLKLARDFLTNDGAVFISIDYHEVHNLRKLCDEIFGEKNLLLLSLMMIKVYLWLLPMELRGRRCSAKYKIV